MLALALMVLTIYISLRDIAEHRISHLSNLGLLVLLICDLNLASLPLTLVALAFNLIISTLGRLGGGDFKLLSVLIVTQGDSVISAQYLELFLIFAGLSLLLTAGARRSLDGSIAMAPAILAPFLILYLAI